MKVKELVEMYKKNQMLDLKKTLEVQEYISIALKKEIADVVLDATLIEVDGGLHVDSLQKYILFTIVSISAHTNLEFADDEDGTSAVEEFDILCETKLLNKIVDAFKDDYNECNIVLDMLYSDRIKNYQTLSKKINNLLNVVYPMLNDSFENIENKEDILKLIEAAIAK